VSRIEKRSHVFFQLINGWVEHVRRTFYKTEHLQWNCIPGYNIIGQALIEEMQKRDVRLYGDSLINSTLAFLENNKLLMCYVRVTYPKTSVHNLPDLMKTLDLTSKWFIKI